MVFVKCLKINLVLYIVIICLKMCYISLDIYLNNIICTSIFMYTFCFIFIFFIQTKKTLKCENVFVTILFFSNKHATSILL